MPSILQLIEDLDAPTLREILERQGYRNLATASVRNLRAAVLDEYQRDLIGGREIRAAIDDREDRIEAANRIIAEQNHTIAAQFMRIRELEARSINKNSVQSPLNGDVHLHKPVASKPMTASASAPGLKVADTVMNEGQPGETGTFPTIASQFLIVALRRDARRAGQ